MQKEIRWINIDSLGTVGDAANERFIGLSEGFTRYMLTMKDSLGYNRDTLIMLLMRDLLGYQRD